ncbi:MAG: hypothetical protein AB3N16_06450 [Flavobacteriaceae bacterium]
MRKGFALFLILSFYIGCNSENSLNVRKGTFKILNDDSTITVILRDGDYQYEYSPDHIERNKLLKIIWKEKYNYISEVVDKKTAFDTLRLFSEIYDVGDNGYYEATFREGTHLKYETHVTKISDTVSDLLQQVLLKNGIKPNSTETPSAKQ